MISQRKIAETLQMPVSTVANILNGTPNYRKETVERVMKAAAELGYLPSRASRSLQRGRSNLIGIAHFGSPYSGANRSITEAIQAITRYGYEHLVVDLHWHAGDVQGVHNEIIQSRVEGVLLIANHSGLFPRKTLSILQKAKIPVVSLYGEDEMDVPLVGGDSELSNFTLARHLQGVGHRKILHFLTDVEAFSVRSRMKGFTRAMEGVGPCMKLSEAEFFRSWKRLAREHDGRSLGIIIKVKPVKAGESWMKRYFEIGKRLFAMGVIPDAIMAPNDQAAFAFFNAAHEYQIPIPEKLALTGADNEELGSYPMFDLTTQEGNITDAAAAAAEILVHHIRREPEERMNLQFPAKLILRRSCGRVCNPEEGEVEAVT